MRDDQILVMTGSANGAPILLDTNPTSLHATLAGRVDIVELHIVNEGASAEDVVIDVAGETITIQVAAHEHTHVGPFAVLGELSASTTAAAKVAGLVRR